MRSPRRLLALLLTGLCAAGAAVAQPALIAAGDSLTFGTGDPEGKGYTRRLEVLLRRELGEEREVINEGRPSDDTFLLLGRFDSVLSHDSDTLLLMVGTNDVTRIFDGEIAPEATAFNIEEMARRANQKGVETVHATIIPRPRYAFRDSRNFLTRRVVWDIREIATAKNRRLVDAYQAFDPMQVLDPTPTFYTSQFDPDTGERDFVGHLNPTGYDRLAGYFADVLLGVDSVPPVIGSFVPGPVGAAEPEVPTNQEFRIPLYEPVGSDGFDTANTTILINGIPVGEPAGKPKRGKLELEHTGLKDLGCIVELAVHAQDRADPPNVLDLVIERYSIRGREINAGDVDFDCVVDLDDVAQFEKSFGSRKGEPNFSDLVDFVNDDRIDGLDFAVLARNFGKSTL